VRFQSAGIAETTEVSVEDLLAELQSALGTALGDGRSKGGPSKLGHSENTSIV